MRFLILIMYAAIYNSYFGWNALPQSDAEVICDGIFAIIALLAIQPTKSEG